MLSERQDEPYLEMLRRPVDESALECLGPSQSDRPLFQGKCQRKTRRPQQRRINQIRMIVGKLGELDHMNLLARVDAKCQMGVVNLQGTCDDPVRTNWPSHLPNLGFSSNLEAVPGP